MLAHRVKSAVRAAICEFASVFGLNLEIRRHVNPAIMPPIAHPPDVSETALVSRCEYFTDLQLWPTETRVNPRAWLSNFQPEELQFALRLLDAFVFIAEPMCDQLLYAAFQGLSRRRTVAGSFFASTTMWRTYCDQVLVTYVTGEHPNATDSGLVFARKARQVLGLGEEQIRAPGEVLQELVQRGPKPVVFLDDFIGTGNQFIQTWSRRYPIPGSSPVSFKDYTRVTPSLDIACCPLLCTRDGASAIETLCPDVEISPAHFLPEQYSAVCSDSVIWPPGFADEARRFLKNISLRIGIPDTGGADVEDWQGFHTLGLTIAFYHSVPDATLPIFYWEQNGWKPLIRRM